MPEELQEVEVPGEAVHVFEGFWKVFGSEPLTWTEIGSYCRLTGDEFEPWELDALIRMDRAVRDEQMKQRRQPEGATDGR